MPGHQINLRHSFITARVLSVVEVMFSWASVFPSVHGGGEFSKMNAGGVWWSFLRPRIQTETIWESPPPPTRGLDWMDILFTTSHLRHKKHTLRTILVSSTTASGCSYKTSIHASLERVIHCAYRRTANSAKPHTLFRVKQVNLLAITYLIHTLEGT